MRLVEYKRETKETKINLKLNIDGKGKVQVNTGIGFFDHMLNALAVHGSFDLNLEADGDLYVDGHHTIEDCGIVLGKAISNALGDKSGINRYGNFWIPMDDALAMVALDVSGRPYLHFLANFNSERIGNYETCLTKEFFNAFAMNAGITLHINLLYGENDHHCCEAIYKAVGHALEIALAASTKQGPLSTKGILE